MIHILFKLFASDTYPEGAKSTATTPFRCPSINMIHFPLRRSHKRPQPSNALAETVVKTTMITPTHMHYN